MGVERARRGPTRFDHEWRPAAGRPSARPALVSGRPTASKFPPRFRSSPGNSGVNGIRWRRISNQGSSAHYWNQVAASQTAPTRNRHMPAPNPDRHSSKSKELSVGNTKHRPIRLDAMFDQEHIALAARVVAFVMASAAVPRNQRLAGTLKRVGAVLGSTGGTRHSRDRFDCPGARASAGTTRYQIRNAPGPWQPGSRRSVRLVSSGPRQRTGFQLVECSNIVTPMSSDARRTMHDICAFCVGDRRSKIGLRNSGGKRGPTRVPRPHWTKRYSRTSSSTITGKPPASAS